VTEARAGGGPAADPSPPGDAVPGAADRAGALRPWVRVAGAATTVLLLMAASVMVRSEWDEMRRRPEAVTGQPVDDGRLYVEILDPARPK
jgi:hypothetical protein